MTTVKSIIWTVFLLISIILLGGCNTDTNKALRIAVAANAQYAMEEIAQNFTKKTGIETELIIASSGKLTAQIEQGAPFHVFISADMKYPETLYKNGFAIDQPKIYAFGTLVLWSLDKSVTLSIQNLDQSDLMHLAIANHKTAPYGRAAIESLKYYNKYESLKNIIVTGESVSQATQYVLTGAAKQGFTALSMLLSVDLKDRCQWVEIDRESYSPIDQGVIVLKNTPEKREEALLFYNHIFSENGQRILEKFGYKPIMSHE